MKKVLSLTFIFLSMLLGLSLGQGVYAFNPDNNSYDQLFTDVQEITVNYEVEPYNLTSDFDMNPIFNQYGVLSDSLTEVDNSYSGFQYINITIKDTNLELTYDFEPVIMLADNEGSYPGIYFNNLDETYDFVWLQFYPGGYVYLYNYSYPSGGVATLVDEFYITFEIRGVETKSTGHQYAVYDDGEYIDFPQITPSAGTKLDRAIFIRHLLAGEVLSFRLYVSFDSDILDETNLIEVDTYDEIGSAYYFISYDFDDDITLFMQLRNDGSLAELDLTGDDISPAEPTWVNYYFEYEVTASVPWTQSYSYGKIRDYNESQNPLYLNHNTSAGVVFISSSAEGQNWNKNWFHDGTEAYAFHSRYSNFRIENATGAIVKNVENVAAVYFEASTTPHEYGRFTIYYWSGNTILKTSYLWENINANYDQIKAYFYGGFRGALTGQENFATNVDDPEDLSFFIDYFQAWDDINGDISDFIEIEEDNYSDNKETVGTYSVTLSIEDTSRNKSYLTFNITVADIVAPELSGSNPDEISYTEEFNTAALNAWLDSLEVTDNYDNADTVFHVEGYTNYWANRTKPGTYTLTVRAEDLNGNISEPYLFELVVFDDVAPEFKNSIEEINTSHNVTFTVAQVKASLSAIDAVDGDVSSSITLISDTYTANKNNPGTWTMLFRAVDSSGNQVDHLITFVVIDDAGQWFVISYPTPPPSLILTPGFTPSLSQIITLLENTNQLPAGFGPEDISANNYIPGVTGVYQLSIGGFDFLVKVLGSDDPLLPPLHPVVPDDSDNTWMIWISVSVLSITGLATAYYFLRKKAKK